jgi:hypothetical protein
MQKMLLIGLLAVPLGLGGCAHTWAPGPGTDIADFEPAKARCSLFARHSGDDFIAMGSQSYVAGASLGYALSESVRAQRDFDDCMVASGWRVADGATAAAQTPPSVQRIAMPPYPRSRFVPNGPAYKEGMDVGWNNPQATCDPPASIQHADAWTAGCRAAQWEYQAEHTTPYR